MLAISSPSMRWPDSGSPVNLVYSLLKTSIKRGKALYKDIWFDHIDQTYTTLQDAQQHAVVAPYGQIIMTLR